MRKAYAFLFSVTVAWSLGIAGHVQASHAPGERYQGTFPGGRVILVVNEDGTRVRMLRVIKDGCRPATLRDVAISDHAFTASAGDTASVTGSFSAPGQATGTLSATVDGNCSIPAGTRWSASAGPASGERERPETRTAAPTATSPPTSTAQSQSLPKSGVAAIVVALTGITLLELGYGLRLLSRRLQTPWHAVPLYLLRRLRRARSRGEEGVEVADGWYLTRREEESPPRPGPDDEPPIGW